MNDKPNNFGGGSPEELEPCASTPVPDHVLEAFESDDVETMVQYVRKVFENESWDYVEDPDDGEVIFAIPAGFEDMPTAKSVVGVRKALSYIIKQQSH